VGLGQLSDEFGARLFSGSEMARALKLAPRGGVLQYVLEPWLHSLGVRERADVTQGVHDVALYCDVQPDRGVILRCAQVPTSVSYSPRRGYGRTVRPPHRGRQRLALAKVFSDGTLRDGPSGWNL